MAPHSELLTKFIASVFNSHQYDQPVHTMRPIHERPTVRPIHERPTVKSIHERTTPRPFLKTSTRTPFWKRPFMRLFPERTTIRPYSERPTIAPPTIVESRHASGLEFLWVALGGIGVLVLMAIFMKFGKPIRRARRQLSNSRPAPNVIVSRHPDAGLFDMDSPLLLSDTAATSDPAPLYADLPPPYSECVRSSKNKHDTEEPPPRFSDCYVSYTNPKDAEPQVHIRRQNVLDKRTGSSSDIVKVQNGLFKNDTIAITTSSNDSEDVAAGIRMELVFDNGRIVKRQSLYLNSR